MAWAEVTLRLKSSVSDILAFTTMYVSPLSKFSPQAATNGETPYVVPWPTDLPFGTEAVWLTDVAILSPQCMWVKTTNISENMMNISPMNLVQPILPSNYSTVLPGIYLVDVGLDVDVNLLLGG